MPLKLTRRPRSKNWYLRGTVRGQAVFESTGTADRDLAESIRIRREGDIEHRSVHGAEATATFLEAAVAYMENGGETRYLGKLIDEFQGLKLIEIDQRRLDKAARKISPDGGGAWRNRSIYTPFIAVWNHAVEDGLCQPRKWRRPKMKKPVTRAGSPDYFRKLLPHCDQRLRAFLIFILNTGCRPSEALGFEKHGNDLSLKEGWARLLTSKNEEPRLIHLPPAVVAELANLPDYPNGRLFGWTDYHRIYRPLKRACKAAGIEYLRPHELGSHSYATWMRQYGGKDSVDLLKTGRWKDIRSVARYDHADINDVKRASDTFPDVQNTSTWKQKIG